MRATLPYQPTRSQEQALAEIKADMAAPRRMLRLLQGVSARARPWWRRSQWKMPPGRRAGGHHGADYVLARQHLETLTPLCEAAGLSLGDLSGREQGKTRAALLEKLAAGGVQIVAGTHALFQPDVLFHELGLAIVDEQHRFGVAQRLALQEKGA